jgi:serine/threonine-protein kinase
VSIAAVPLAGGEIRRVISDGRSSRYASSGHLFYQRSESDDLMVVGFDPERAMVSGTARRVTTVARVNEVAAFAVADDGTLAYSMPGEVTDWTRYTLVAVDQDGKERVLLDEIGTYAQPRVSPDGQKLLYRRISQPYCDLWTLDLARGTRTRVTIEGDNHNPLWHPNSTDISWSSELPSGHELRMGPIDRSRPVQTLAKGTQEFAPASWSHDGTTLAVVRPSASDSVRQRADDLTFDIDFLGATSGSTRPFLATPFSESQAAFSPAGEWIAWVSNESGRNEVYIERVSGGGRLQISTEGGNYPVWSSDGRKVHYSDGSRLMAVDLPRGQTQQPGRPRVALEGAYAWDRSDNYDVIAGGRGFVVVKRTGQLGATATLRVVLNWQQLAESTR